MLMSRCEVTYFSVSCFSSSSPALFTASISESNQSCLYTIFWSMGANYWSICPLWCMSIRLFLCIASTKGSLLSLLLWFYWRGIFLEGWCGCIVAGSLLLALTLTESSKIEGSPSFIDSSFSSFFISDSSGFAFFLEHLSLTLRYHFFTKSFRALQIITKLMIRFIRMFNKVIKTRLMPIVTRVSASLTKSVNVSKWYWISSRNISFIYSTLKLKIVSKGLRELIARLINVLKKITWKLSHRWCIP